MVYKITRIFYLIKLFIHGYLAVILPTFDRSSENVTVIIGNSASLPCFISNLGDHRVRIYSILAIFESYKNRVNLKIGGLG